MNSTNVLISGAGAEETIINGKGVRYYSPGLPRNEGEKIMAKKRIFVSYDYDNDKHYKDLLVAWDANSEFDFISHDESVDAAVNSDDTAAIRRLISARISHATYFLCLIGKETYKSEWITWEINKAIEFEKKLIAVKIKSGNMSPSAIVNVGACWAVSFAFEFIKKAIENAQYTTFINCGG